MTCEPTPPDNWDPATPAELAGRFSGPGAPWWVAGGLAIEFAVGRPVREHADTDVLLLRRDQLAVRQALPGWGLWAADPPGELRPWTGDEILPVNVHDVWCRPGPGEPWRIQVMLDESLGSEWVSRRDRRVRRPLTALGATSVSGIPYLAPEVQLYYKAGDPRPKDEADLTAALPVLDAQQRDWLGHAIALTYGPHPWAGRLEATCPGG